MLSGEPVEHQNCHSRSAWEDGSRELLSGRLLRPRSLSWLAKVLMVVPAVAAFGGPMAPPVQVGNLLRMTNGNVRLDYDLSTGRADFSWRNSLKISGFYSGIGLSNYITGNIYSQRTWAATNNQVTITLTGGNLPLMKQVFVLDQDNSFLTRLEVYGTNLESRWMGPLVMDRTGGVNLGSSGDNRALVVPFDNDSFSFSYNALPLNNTAMSYEVCAFYDNTSRHGLVVGSVTHDQWKSGVYFQGANNRLNVLNVFGGVASGDTHDVMEHGVVRGNPIVSPTAFVGFGDDWRKVMEDYARANVALVPAMAWEGGVPFGWNSWYAHTSGVNFASATAASLFIRDHLQTNQFQNQGTVYINLDSYWSNLSDSELRQFSGFCHSNGQKAGIYWAPFVYWGTAAQGSNSFMTATAYRWSAAYLRTADGQIQILDGGIALDPTHPGTRQMAVYYLNYFLSRGFDYLKLDFLSHGALEGVHYDPSITTGIQAYNQGMRFLAEQSAGRMFLSAAISPIFPYQYAHARRMACDTSTFINETAFQLLSLSYGWWISGHLYRFSDPDIMKFAGATPNENQSRLISAAISGTVFLNGDDLESDAGRALAKSWLTNSSVNEVARDGLTFHPVEGNTGDKPADLFVRQDGATWYLAAFNYSPTSAIKPVNLERVGVSGTFTAVDLLSRVSQEVSGPTWNISLGAKQAKLFRLDFVDLSAPSLQVRMTGTNLMLEWPFGHTGWRLQTQTNTWSASAATNWSDIAGSSSTNRWLVPVSGPESSRFFRLAYP